MAERLAAVRRAGQFHVAAIGQTFFVENWVTGIAAIGVLAITAPRLALCGLIVSIAARLAAGRIGAPRDLLATGLVELNGWFFGLACGTFFTPGAGLCVALVVGGPLVAAAAIAMRRLLATWDLPMFVGPYMPAFWLAFAAIAAFPWAQPAVLSASASSTVMSPALVIVLGGLRGLGEIFFVPDARVGLALAAVVSIADRRLGVCMIAASIAAVAIGYAAGAPAWQVEQGLAGFAPALTAAAALRGFAGVGRVAVAIAIVTGALLEAGALRITGGLGLYALSSSYLVIVWGTALLRPVRDAAAERRGWSSAPAPRERPRLFEVG